jgi:hypothetical protein
MRCFRIVFNNWGGVIRTRRIVACLNDWGKKKRPFSEAASRNEEFSPIRPNCQEQASSRRGKTG